MGMSHANTPSSHTIESAQTHAEKVPCNGPLCSVQIMKGFCPTCVLLGVVILPFELIFRAVRNLFRGNPRD